MYKKAISSLIALAALGIPYTYAAEKAVEAAADAATETATEAVAVGVWTQDFDAAVKLAAEKELPLMLNFTGSDWCHWCKLMDEKVFAQDEWKEYAAENAVLVTLDFPRGENIVPKSFVARNEKLKGQFGVRGFPTYIVLDSDAQTVLGQLGAGKDKTPASFIAEFKRSTLTSASGIEAFKKANPDKAEAFEAAIVEHRAVKKEFEAWIGTKPEVSPENDKKFAAFQERMKAADEKLSAF